MYSWQYYISMFYLRVMKLFAPPPGVNVARSRRDMVKNGRMFNRSGPWQITPVKIGELDAEWTVAEGIDSGRVVLYFHGGSFNSGSPETHRGMVGMLAKTISGRCLSVDYRLAPEHTFPAGVQDAQQAYEWLLMQDVPANRVSLAGDSAGGGLCMSLLVALRQAGRPLPASAVLFCPCVDLTMSGETIKTNAKRDLLLHPVTVRQEIEMYLAGADPLDPLASPLFADLHDMPPIMLQAGADDILLSDSTRLAEKLQQAGVEVLLDVEPRGQHDYQYAAAFAPEARRALERAGKFILEH